MGSKISSIKNNSFWSIMKGVLVSISITLVLILLLALIIRFFNINDSFIFPINQVIKVISLFVGVITILRDSNERGFVKGLLLGLLYCVFSFIIFSILQGDINFRMATIYDCILTMLMGGIIGIILVNIRRKV